MTRKKFLIPVLIILFFYSFLSAQESNGPASGSSNTGVLTSTYTISAINLSKLPAKTQIAPLRYPAVYNLVKKMKTQILPTQIDAVINVEDVADPEVEPLAPPMITNFEGISYTGWIPPDPILAVGPEYLVAVVNSSWAIYDKTGTELFLTTLDTWFSNVSPPGSAFDPKVIYDHHAGRWVILALSYGPSSSSYLISVSDDSNPNGSWWNWNLDAAADGSTPTNNGADFPGLGFDENSAVYITSNQFDDYLSGSFEYAKLRILYKSQLYWEGTGGALSWWDFWSPSNEDASLVFTWKPAHTFDTPGVEYLVNTHWNGGTSVTLWALTNPLGAPPTLTRQATVATGSYSVPPNAAQPGVSIPTDYINTGDCRTQDVQYRNGYIYTAFTEGHDWGGGTVSAIRYLKINTSSNTADLNITYGADGSYYYYPTIYTDQAENIFLVFNRSSSLEYAGIRYTGHLITDAVPQGSAQLKGGEGFYKRLDGIERNRWGDYNGIGVDPSDGSNIWIYSEYATDVNTWGTWIGQVSFEATQTAPITFEADLTNFIAAGWFNPSDPADSIVVNGSFNGWNSQEKMTPDSGDPNIYKYTVDLTMNPGEFIEWKFKLFPEDYWQNGGWEWGDNRLTEFTGDEIVLDPIEPNVSPMQHFIPVEPTGRIQPVYIVDVTLDGVQLQPGDEVAVLDGDLVVGAAQIQELPMINPISVYLTYTPPGGDPLPGAQDGNDLLFRVWDQSEGREECSKISEVVTGAPVFAEGAIVAVSLEAPCEITQSIGIRPAFLNLISFNVHPVDPSAVAVFDPIYPWLVIVQDHEGLVYIPPDIVFPGHPGSNTIDANTGIKIEKGYNVFINSGEEQTLEVTGLAVKLNEITISVLPQFLNKISFPSQQVMLIQDVFSGIVNQHIYNDLSIVQDHDGYVYIPPNIVFPGHPGSNTIDPNGGLQPGKGYMLYHRNSGELSFTYPEAAEAASLAKAKGGIEKELPQHYTCVKTGEPHALFIKNINVHLEEGDEFGVYADGLCVGSKRYVDNLNDPLIIWRALPDYDLKGIKDGDNVEIRLWKAKSKTIEILELDGDIVFNKERVFSLVKISSGLKSDGLNLVSDMIPKEMGLRQNYPNPFNPTTTIEISLNKDTDISLMIYNIRGEVVKQLASGSYSSGRYLVEWDGRNENGIQVASGIYIYRLQAGAFVVNRKMIISK